MQQLAFFISGNHFSGAEKRMLLTAIKLAVRPAIAVTIFISKDLHESILKSSRFDASELQRVRFVLAPKSAFGAKSRKLQIVMSFLSKLRVFALSKPIVHIALYSMLDLVCARWIRRCGGTVIFEVTSPDVAVSSNTRRLAADPRYSDTLICVSKNVLRLVKEHQQSQQVNIVQRQQPFVDEDSTDLFDYSMKTNTVVYSHRLIARKNPQVAVDAFCAVAPHFPDWKFVICGRGEDERVIEETIKESDCENVVFLGYIPDVQDVIREAKVFVSLIEPDNYPSQSVLEALARGCSLVVSDTGESVSKFLDTKDSNGIAVNISAEQVIAALQSLLSNTELEAICRHSAEYFQKNFSQQRYLQESYDFYQ